MKIILKPDEKQMKTLAKVSEITNVDYDGKEWHEDILLEDLFNALENMLYEYHRLEEKLEEENYVEEPDPYKMWRDEQACK